MKYGANMTNPSSSISAPNPHVGDLTVDDPRRYFAGAVAVAGKVIAGVSPDQFDKPTPCTEFDVRQLTGHLVFVLRRVAAVGRGEDPFSVAPVVEGIADDAWVANWAEAAHDVQTVWSQPGILDRLMRLPFATLPGAVAMAIYTAEVTVHTWDLATATKQVPSWDDEVVAVALNASERALPAEGRGPELPFGPVVAVPSDAPLIDRLVAWNGRRP